MTEMNDTKRKKFLLCIILHHGLAMHLEVVAATPVLQLNHNTGFLVQQSHVTPDLLNYIVV